MELAKATTAQSIEVLADLILALSLKVIEEDKK